MAKIVVREKETLEDALRRFKRDVEKAEIIKKKKKKEFYVKPSEERKARLRANRQKARRASR